MHAMQLAPSASVVFSVCEYWRERGLGEGLVLYTLVLSTKTTCKLTQEDMLVVSRGVKFLKVGIL